METRNQAPINEEEIWILTMGAIGVQKVIQPAAGAPKDQRALH